MANARVPQFTAASDAPAPTPVGGRVGLLLILVIALPCFLTLPWSVSRYDVQQPMKVFSPPSFSEPMGTDDLGRSLLWRCLLGGAISLGIGLAAAAIAVGIGTCFGAVSGLWGGRVDAVMMRLVDVLYGLPYILLVVMISLTLYPALQALLTGPLGLGETLAANAAGIATLLVAIGGVSWLTMARVIRGQVLSLRAQPFIEATRAVGVRMPAVLWRHLLPNLTGVIVVYATLAVPVAILQESFLSFLGIGVRVPLPSWGSLASAGVQELPSLTSSSLSVHWWRVVFPCALLGLTLLALNLLGDALRERLDPKRTAR